MNNKVDELFTIKIDKELSKLRDLEFEYKGIKFSAPIYLLLTEEFINTVISKIAEITSTSQKFNCNPMDSIIIIQLFEHKEKYEIDSLNKVCNSMLKYKELGLIPVVYPYTIEIECEYYDEDNALRKLYDSIQPIKRISDVFYNYRILTQIIRYIVKNEFITSYHLFTDENEIFLQEPYIEGYNLLQFTNLNNVKVKELKVKVKYTTFYTIDIDYINYLIYQNMKKPKNVIINKDTDTGKYIFSWEY